MHTIPSVLTEKEITNTAEMLQKLSPGFLPLPIFYQVARLTVTPTVELVPLRMHEGHLQVFLTQRPKDDPVWPSMLHVPGSVIRATDTKETFSDVLDRILHNELHDPQIESKPHFFTYLFHQVKRGAEIAFIHYTFLLETPKNGSFYFIHDLPSSLVSHQRGFIQEIAKSLER